MLKKGDTITITRSANNTTISGSAYDFKGPLFKQMIKDLNLREASTLNLKSGEENNIATVITEEYEVEGTKFVIAEYTDSQDRPSCLQFKVEHCTVKQRKEEVVNNYPIY